MKKYVVLLFTFVLVLGLVACGNTEQTTETNAQPKEKLTIKHSLGETEISKNPKKVVVFDLGVLDSLDTIGVEVVGLPKASKLPTYLKKYEDKKYADVGSLKEPNLEKINELAPDLIIISGRQQQMYKEFQEIAPTISLEINTKKYMASFEENMNTLGKIFVKEKEVTDKLATIRATIKTMNEQAKASNKKALIILANDAKISAYGSGSRFGIIHDVFGVPAIDTSIKSSTHGQSITFEYVAEKNPDILYVVDRTAVVGGKTSAKQLIENELVKKTKAYQNGKIIYLDPQIWYLSGGGLVSIDEMAKAIASSLK